MDLILKEDKKTQLLFLITTADWLTKRSKYKLC